MHFKSMIFAGTAMAAVAFAAAPTINTPSPIIQCQAYQVTFSGGTPPYTLYATKEGDTSDILTEIGSGITGTSYSWTVNLASGTSINLYIVDSTGASNASGGATVLSSSNTGCLSGSSSGGSSSSSTSAASGSSSSASSSGSTPSSSASRSSQSSGGSGTSSTSSSGSQSTGGSNGASQLTGFSAAVAGAVGVVVAALV